MKNNVAPTANQVEKAKATLKAAREAARKPLTAEQIAKKERIEEIATEKGISKVMAKAFEGIERLVAKKESEGLNTQETVFLVNNKHKIESKSASYVYRLMQDMDAGERADILGNSSLPSFKEFTGKLNKDQKFFTYFNGLQVLAKFNKAAAIKTKLDKQGGKIEKKAA